MTTESAGDAATPPAKKHHRGIQRLEFGHDKAFQETLHRRIDEWFDLTGRHRRGGWRMYGKTLIILAAFAACYGLLVFWAHTWWQAMPLAVGLALCTAGIGFNIQHDGGHRGYSRHRWLNHLTAWTMDLVGSSSIRWHWKHSVIHHRYVNITGYDDDIDVGWLGRVSPHQRRRWFHRWQHLYLWPLYGLLAVKLQLVDDFRYLITGKIGAHNVPRPTGWALVIFILGKAAFLTWAFALPMLLHPIGVVLFYYVFAALVLGNVMALVFIVPHLVDQAEFPLPHGDQMDRPWAVHQALVTVNFAPRNRVMSWLLGGLNYHKEHHLFPLVSHVNYPGMAEAVETTCREFGVPYNTHRSFRAGIAAHYRWLRRMGRED